MEFVFSAGDTEGFTATWIRLAGSKGEHTIVRRFKNVAEHQRRGDEAVSLADVLIMVVRPVTIHPSIDA